MKTDDEKAEEILKKRRLAAKGLTERPDGAPVDPMEDLASLDPDGKRPAAGTDDEPVIDTARAAALGQVR